MRVKSKAYIAAGFVCVVLGIAGIPLPLLPTTPFLLLAAFCFARGSERWHQWLMTHPTLSPYILAFQGKRGLTRIWPIVLAVRCGALPARRRPRPRPRAMRAETWVCATPATPRSMRCALKPAGAPGVPSRAWTQRRSKAG